MTEPTQNEGPRRRGRPATGQGTLVGVRLDDELLAELDNARRQVEPKPTRPEMIRRIVREALKDRSLKPDR